MKKNKTISLQGATIKIRQETPILLKKRQKFIGQSLDYTTSTIEIIEQKHYTKFIEAGGDFWRIARCNILDITTCDNKCIWDNRKDQLLLN